MLTLRGGGAQVVAMNMLYLLASVAQLLALRVLVVLLSLWVLEDLCYNHKCVIIISSAAA